MLAGGSRRKCGRVTSMTAAISPRRGTWPRVMEASPLHDVGTLHYIPHIVDEKTDACRTQAKCEGDQKLCCPEAAFWNIDLKLVIKKQKIQ